MSRRAITWNRDLFKAAVEAYGKARSAGKREVVWELDGQGTHTLLVSEAGTILNDLADAFSQPDQPRRPYNEGEEGQ